VVAVAVIVGCSQNGLKLEEPDVTAFANVNVVPMNKDTVLENYTVVVDDGKIASAAPVDEIVIPENARVIDGTGRFLMPGLVDMHVHLEHEDALTLFLANGVTTVRNMWGTASHLVWRERINNGEIVGPTIYTAGPIIDGPPGIWDGSVVFDNPDSAEQLVIDHIQNGYDFLKVYYLKEGAFKALIAAAKKHDIPVIGHASDDVGQEGVLFSGQHSIEHLDGYWKMLEADDSPYRRDDFDYHSYIMTWNYIDESKMPAAASLTKQSGIWNCPTLVVYERDASHVVADSLYSLPEMRYMDPVSLASWDPTTYFATMRRTDEEWEANNNTYPELTKLTGYLHRAGARLLLGTDCLNSFVVPGFSVHNELQNFIRAGLTPYEAIRTGTYNVAECLGALDEFGTIAPSLRADLILLEDNPLEDIKNLTNRVGVMVRGRWFPEKDLHGRLEEIVSSYVPPKDRFEGVAPIESKGEPILSAHYEFRYNEISFGEERLRLFSLDGNRYELISQTVTDRPYLTQTSVSMALDSSLMCDHIEYLNETSTGNNSLEFDLEDDSLYVGGRLKGDVKLDQRRFLAQNEFMNPPRAGVCVSDVPVMASFVQFGGDLLDLDVGDSAIISNISHQLSLPYDFVEETVVIKRLPDSEKMQDDEVDSLRMYSYDVSLPHAAIHSELATDEEGTVVSLKVEQQIGNLSVQLVNKGKGPSIYESQ